jgi:hypothetical protein
MADLTSFKVVHASVRPHRVAVLVDKNDPDWQDTSLRVIEFYARLWGGAYNLIIPTDGEHLDERFWTILETFDPDCLIAYRKSGEDLLVSHPDQYEKKLTESVDNFLAQTSGSDRDWARAEIDRN